MHVISRKKLLEFAAEHGDVFTTLDNWFRVAKAASWRNLHEVQQVYPSAEAVGNFTLFNIKGNNYRLIADVVYSSQTIYIKYVLTHAEYDKEKWKNDPYF